jgi:adenylate cyclase
VVEVEFASRQEAEAFDPPDWFGAELTGAAGWSNAALARHGAPPDA